MQYRKDNLSILGMGCMRLPSTHEASEKLILKAIEQGINYYDTAYIYPGSEATLGRILFENNVRDSVKIATKLPLQLVRSARDFDRYFAKQLERLRTDRVDYYLMHAISDLASWEALCAWGIEEWIAEKKRVGQIGRIGFSFHGARDEFMALLDAYAWDFCQIQLNYSDERYQAGVAGLERAAEKGLPVIIMEPLLGGKLAGGLPAGARDALREGNPERSPAAWALGWLFDKPEVSVVLSGMNHPDQLLDNVHTANAASPGMLTEADRAVYQRVQRIFAETNKVACTGCGYCLPCPKHVNIPACFSAYNTSFSIGKRTGLHQYMLSTGPFARLESRASLCVACGQCEARCPQNIPIIQSLRDVRARLEPAWYGVGIRLLRFVLGKNRPLTGTSKRTGQ